MDENRKAATRGVKIERVFILRHRDEFAKKMPLLEANHAAGVKVRYVFENELQEPFTQDVILVDDKIAGVLNLVRQSARGVEFSANPDAVDRVSKVLKIAFIQAQEFVPGQEAKK